MQRIFMLLVKLVAVGVIVAGLGALTESRSYGAGEWNNTPAASCSFISPQRTGGISEMASCGKSGVRGNRAQFLRAIKRHVENRYFLSQLQH
jgi:hypothetical protein